MGTMSLGASAAGSMSNATTTFPLTGSFSGSVLDGGYYSYPSVMYLTYGEQTISFTEGISDSDIYFTVTNITKPDEAPEKRSGKTAIHPGTGYTQENSSKFIYLSLGYNFEDGNEYRVSLPAGIFQNANGETNPQQDFTFHVCKKTFSFYDATVTPEISTTGAYYTNDKLSDVTVNWNFNLSKTNIGEILGYYAETEGTTTKYNYVNLTDKARIEGGSLHLDLSSLTDGYWSIVITEGFFTADVDGENKINSQVSLNYRIITPQEFIAEDFKCTDPGNANVTQLASATVVFGQPISLVENAPTITCTKGNTSYPVTPNVKYERDGTYSLSIVFAQTLTEAGIYHFSIPAGVVTNGKYTNNPHEFDVRITPYFSGQTINPEPGIVSSKQMENIVITFPGIQTVTLTENAPNITIRDSKYQTTNLSFDDNVEISGNTVTIKIPNLVAETYTLTISPFTFMLDDTYVNEYMYPSYTVWDGMPAAKVLEAPANTGYAGPDGQILLHWEGQTVTPTNDFAIKYKFTNQGWLEDFAVISQDCFQLLNYDSETSTSHNALRIDLSKLYEEFTSNEDINQYYLHNITVLIPEGILANEDGLLNPLQSFSFYFYPFAEGEPRFEELDIEGIYSIVWPDVNRMNVNYGPTMQLIDQSGKTTEITCGNTYQFATPEAGKFQGAYQDPDTQTGYCLQINLSNVEDGEYTLVVPAGVVSLYQGNDAITQYINKGAEFPILIGEASIVELANKDVEYKGYDVFTLHGVRVLHTDNISDLNSLPKGLYIINGKKVFIRK